MFDSQCDVAAMVYEKGEHPDAVLRAFAAELDTQGYRAIGLVQCGHHCLDASQLSAMILHTGEEM